MLPSRSIVAVTAALDLTDDDGSTLHYDVDNSTGVATLAAVDRSPTRVNRDTIRAAAVTALTNNRDYLANATPTAGQVGAQVKALTRQVQALIRLTLNQLAAADDT